MLTDEQINEWDRLKEMSLEVTNSLFPKAKSYKEFANVICFLAAACVGGMKIEEDKIFEMIKFFIATGKTKEK